MEMSRTANRGWPLTRSRRPRPAPSARRAASAGKPPSSCIPGSGSGYLRCTTPTLWPLSRPRTDPEVPRRPRRESGSWRRCRPTCCPPVPRCQGSSVGRRWAGGRLTLRRVAGVYIRTAARQTFSQWRSAAEGRLLSDWLALGRSAPLLFTSAETPLQLCPEFSLAGSPEAELSHWFCAKIWADV